MKSKANYGNNQKDFSLVPGLSRSRSMFKRQFTNKTTFNEGYLIPVHIDEIYAGDTVNIDVTGFVRLTTPLAPSMDNIQMDLHAFFVPHRLTFPDYYKMMGERENPDSPPPESYSIPLYSPPGNQFHKGDLGDYFGLPTEITIPASDLPINTPFIAYNLIYNDWFRDENLQDSLKFDDIDLNIVHRRNKVHDYFTSCLPFAQKGEAVNIPIGVSAPLVFIPDAYGNDTKVSSRYSTYAGSSTTGIQRDSGVDRHLKSDITFPIDEDFKHTHAIEGYADLSSATAVSINELRDAISIQHMLERSARAGTRDTEILQSVYGTSPTDSRLQRPELIGSSRANLSMSPLSQSSFGLPGTTTLGDLGGVGVISSNCRFNYSAVENGFIIVLASSRCDLNYQQGMPKMFSKNTFLDIMDPLRANLGEQPVLRKELYTSANPTDNNIVFGYQPQYEDLRYGRNSITGEFRSNLSASLDVWHYAEYFSNAPVLGSEFIQQDSPIERTLAVPGQDHFYGDFLINCNHQRVLPVNSIPGLSRI